MKLQMVVSGDNTLARSAPPNCISVAPGTANVRCSDWLGLQRGLRGRLKQLSREQYRICPGLKGRAPCNELPSVG